VYREGVEIDVPDLGRIRGDIAYGGNWFFLVETPLGELRLHNLDFLMSSSKAIRRALHEAGITGADNKPVDHVEFYGPPTVRGADSKNFVLCPGSAYDRSCCGTGTSAKMACLHAKGKLELRKLWTQESITGSIFEGWLEKQGDRIIPHIRSSAHVISRSTLYFDPNDEFCWGIE
jgi:4-hydroxyproline epimerase